MPEKHGKHMQDITLNPLLRKQPYTGAPGFEIILTGRGPELRVGGRWLELSDLVPAEERGFTASTAALASGALEQCAPRGAALACINDFLDATLAAGAAITCPRTPKAKLDTLLRETRRQLQRPAMRRNAGKKPRPDTRLRQLTRAAALAKLNAFGDWKEALWWCALEFEALHTLGLRDRRHGGQAAAELLAARIAHSALIDQRLGMNIEWQVHAMERELVRDGIFPPGFSLDAAEDFFA